MKSLGKIILVTGGARSGKSSFAEQYAAKTGGKIAYIATAQILDEEMKYRVDLHKKRRPINWITYESPYDAEQAIKQASSEVEVVLFDCLTLYVSNMLCSDQMPTLENERYSYVKNKIGLLINAVKNSNLTVIFVTNEVGMGIVPINQMAREYRDLAGLTNQMMAAVADCVYLVISGMAVDVKKIAINLEE